MRLRHSPITTQANLSTSTSSQSGVVPAQGDTVIVVSAYAFVFDTAALIEPKALDWNVEEVPLPFATDPDAPHWLMINRHTAPRLYTSIWRHINP